MEQGTKEWLQWRHKGIGASDVPIIMGVSPYKKAYRLFEEKIQDEPPVNVSNWAMEKGNQKEPIARAKMEIILGMTLTPKLIEHHTHLFLRFSSDGLNVDHKINIEVKYVGENFQDECPEKYIPQVQFQSSLLGPDWTNYYVQINDKNEIRYFIVPIDPVYCRVMFATVADFWDQVQNKKWIVDPILKEDLITYEALKAEYDDIEDRLKDLKKKIFANTDVKFNYDKFSVITVNKSGGYDWQKIVNEKLPDLKPEELLPYAKSGSSHKEIRIKKEKVAKESEAC